MPSSESEVISSIKLRCLYLSFNLKSYCMVSDTETPRQHTHWRERERDAKRRENNTINLKKEVEEE